MHEAHRHLDMERQVPRLVIDVVRLEGEIEAETRIVDEHLDRSGRVGQARGDPVTLALAAQIRDEDLERDPVLARQLGAQPFERTTIAGDEDEIRAARSQLPGVFGAEPRARPRDQRRLGHRQSRVRERRARCR